jgi:tetrahydromethanopterin S-methyltransferase subunit G
MGFIEEGRQLIQDFVTPEIRAIEARLDAIEKQVAALDAKTDKRIDQLEAKIDRNQTHMEGKIDRNQAQVLDTLNRMETYAHVLERLARIESKLQNVA